MAAMPEALCIEPTGQHQLTIIFCSGRGAINEEFKEELEEGMTKSGIPVTEVDPEHTKWVILSAPERQIVFGEMPEWFDLASTSNPYGEQERQMAGLVESVHHIRRIIDEETKLVDRIYLAGMSQGMAVSSHVLLSSEQDFAGYIGVAGWIPVYGQDKGDKTKAAMEEVYGGRAPKRDTKVLIMHCADDSTIEVEYGRDAAATMEASGFAVEYVEFEEGDHTIKETEGFDAIAAFVGIAR